MKHTRMLLVSMAAVAAVALASCMSGGRELVIDVGRTPNPPVCDQPAGYPLPRADTLTVGPGGGTLRVGPHSLKISSGALDSAVVLHLTEQAGNHIRLDIERADGGTVQFAEAAKLTINVRPRCPGSVSGSSLSIWRDSVQELRTYSGWYGLKPSRRITYIDHNSYYIVAD